ncbi:MAG: hypothetical protein Q9162_003356 [Coniocarpon cinnabarinum]
MAAQYSTSPGVANQYAGQHPTLAAASHHNGYAQNATGGHYAQHNGSHFNRSSSEDNGSPNSKEKIDGEDLETVHTNERVGSHTNYYEKGGLRTEGDGMDHVGSHNKMTFRTWGAIIAMCFLWTESQIPVYLFGGVVPEIYGDIGGVDRWIWMIIGNLIALAAICPFTGAISDLIGRRYIAIIGSLLIIIGMCVSSTATNMNNMIGGMTIAGAGAGINELTAIAGTAELVPTAKRGPMVGLVVFSIVPFCPSIMYAQLITKASSWRYVGLLCGVWAFVGLVTTIVFYFPPKRLNSEGYSKKKIAGRIDYVGGLLSISGVLLFTMGLQFGAEEYAYTNAHVLVPLILGFFLIVAFCFWEAYGTRYPMVPGRLKKDPRVLALTLVITFFSGANFFALLFFWPTQAYNVYGNDPVGVGIRGLPIGFCIIGGAVIALVLIGVTKGRIRAILVFFSALMTAGTGAMAIVKVYNLSEVYIALTLGSLGVGGVIIPCSVITTIICPDDLIATITALTLSIRVIGGAIGFTIYYNIFYHKFVPLATQIVGIEACAQQLLLLNETLVTNLVTAAGNGQFQLLKNMTDQFQSTPNAYPVIIGATQVAFAQAYNCFLGDIKKYMLNTILE